MSMKKCNDEFQPVYNKQRNHSKRGPSSFNMHDSICVFKEMNLKAGEIFVDLGCGIGEYSLYASRLVGENGKVIAVDVWAEMLDNLREEACSLNLANIKTIESDICQSINLTDHCADHCLLATVMHAQKITGKCKNLFPEIARILKPGAQLAIIECKKEEMPFGPPLSMRIAPEDLEKGIISFGFQKSLYVDLGYNYLMLFRNTIKNQK